jgi:MarR family transcriptional regulator, lower aerobic nicotinate degradation pathway regulator
VPSSENSIGLVYLLKRAELAVRGCAEVCLAQFGLTPTQFLLLFRLRESENVSSADLARTIGVRPQSIVDLIRPLEKEGWITRREAPEHRRILRIRLSAAGERLLDRAIPAARQLEEELFSVLSDRENDALRGTLTRLVESAQAHEAHPLARRPGEDGGEKMKRRRGVPAARPVRRRQNSGSVAARRR